jgi:hypothetical protein
MKALLIFILVLCFLAACSSEGQRRTQETIGQATYESDVSETPSPKKTRTASAIAVTASLLSTPTRAPRQATSPAPTVDHSTPTTPAATLSAEATLTAFGDPCVAPALRPVGAEISPDGQWIAIACGQVRDGEGRAYLQVSRVAGTEHWRIFYEDYAGDTEFNRGNLFTPFYWSRDGRFLYVDSDATWSGWFGVSDTQALLRLTLTTGQVDPIVNLIPKRWYTAWFSFSPSDDYLLYIPQDEQTELHLIELSTWSTKLIDFEDDRSNAAGFEVWSPDEKEILLLVGRGAQDQGVYSLVLVNLVDSSQAVLVDNIENWLALLPDRWYAENQVVLRNNSWSDSFGETILLDIRTGALTEFVQP